jgi:hypothetical protein
MNQSGQAGPLPDGNQANPPAAPDLPTKEHPAGGFVNMDYEKPAGFYKKRASAPGSGLRISSANYFSNAKICFQSFFMLMTTQPSCCASS